MDFVTTFDLRRYPNHPGHLEWRQEQVEKGFLAQEASQDEVDQWLREQQGLLDRYEQLTGRSTPTFRDGVAHWRQRTADSTPVAESADGNRENGGSEAESRIGTPQRSSTPVRAFVRDGQNGPTGTIRAVRAPGQNPVAQQRLNERRGRPDLPALQWDHYREVETDTPDSAEDIREALFGHLPEYQRQAEANHPRDRLQPPPPPPYEAERPVLQRQQAQVDQPDERVEPVERPGERANQGRRQREQRPPVDLQGLADWLDGIHIQNAREEPVRGAAWQGEYGFRGNQAQANAQPRNTGAIPRQRVGAAPGAPGGDPGDDPNDPRRGRGQGQGGAGFPGFPGAPGGGGGQPGGPPGGGGPGGPGGPGPNPPNPPDGGGFPPNPPGGGGFPPNGPGGGGPPFGGGPPGGGPPDGDGNNQPDGQPRGRGNQNPKAVLKMQKLSKSTCSPQEFARFQRSAELAKAANRLNDQDFVYHVLGNLVGDAADSARSLSEDVTSYASINDFFKRLKERFVTCAHATIAKQRFGFVSQGENESLRAFHNKLHTLWRDSFAPEDEPWLFNRNIPCPFPNTIAEPGRRCKRLIDKFLAGIRSDVIRVSMRNNAYLNKIVYDDYTMALEHSLALDASLGQIKSERQQLKISAKAQLVDPTFDNPKVHHTYESIRGDHRAGSPMELGYTKKGRKGKRGRKSSFRKFKRRPQRRTVHAHFPPDYEEEPAKESSASGAPKDKLFYCSYHKSDKHNDKDCRALKKNKGDAKGGSWNNQSTNSFRDNRGGEKRKKGQCFKCGKTGHWRRECNSKPKWTKKGRRKPNLGFLERKTFHSMSSDSESDCEISHCLTTTTLPSQENSGQGK